MNLSLMAQYKDDDDVWECACAGTALLAPYIMQLNCYDFSYVAVLDLYNDRLSTLG
jgi:hypothetical protein